MRKLQLPAGSLFWYTVNMAKSITVHPKRRGRPATGRDPAVTIRVPEKVLDAVEEWAANQDDTPARSPAIVRLVEIGLSKSQRLKAGSAPPEKAPRAMADTAGDLHKIPKAKK